jgi:hypothetical protein
MRFAWLGLACRNCCLCEALLCGIGSVWSSSNLGNGRSTGYLLTPMEDYAVNLLLQADVSAMTCLSSIAFNISTVLSFPGTGSNHRWLGYSYPSSYWGVGFADDLLVSSTGLKLDFLCDVHMTFMFVKAANSVTHSKHLNVPISIF